MDLEEEQRRRELGRLYARRHYYKTLNRVQELQAQIQELEKQLEHCYQLQAVANSSTPPSHRLEELQVAHDELIRENRSLRKRRDAYLRWQFELGREAEHHLATMEPAQTAIQRITAATAFIPAEPARPTMSLSQMPRRLPWRHWNLALKHPLTLIDCHAMTRRIYADIQAFYKSNDLVSSGVSVFGWTDRRRVDEHGVLKFLLEKEFRNRSADEIMMRTWSVVSLPHEYEKLFSESMNMRCELVQQIDASNMVFYNEYEIRETNPSTGETVVIIDRTLLLHTIFQTANGYIMLLYTMEPSLLANWPDCCGPRRDGSCLHRDSKPNLTWTSYERSGPTGEDCSAKYVGTVHARNINRGYWAIEVLLVVLQWEGFVIGPQFHLPAQSDEQSGT